MAPGMILWGQMAGTPVSMPHLNPYVSKRASSSGSRGLRSSSTMDRQGDFNGSCTKEEAMTVTPETPVGSCTSYFEDVTDYCCAAVGGAYNATFTAVNVTDEQALALDHPICVTSNYADMFSCYQYATETHCSGTTPIPYGVCSQAGPDTSRSVQGTSSAQPERKLGKQLQVGMLLYAGIIASASIYAFVSFADPTEAC